MAAYTTSTVVGTVLGTTFSSSTDPTQTEVNSIIARVEDFIEKYTGRIWTSATTTEFFDTFDETRLAYGQPLYSIQDVQKVFFLSNRPVISIDSLQENRGGLSSEDWASRATGYANDALFYGAEGYVWFHNQAPTSGRRNVKITYTHGVTPTPNDIAYATELLSAAEVANMIKRASDQEGLKSVSIGDASYDFGDMERQIEKWEKRATGILEARGRTIRAEML